MLRMKVSFFASELRPREQEELHLFLQKLVRYGLWATAIGTGLQFTSGFSLAPLLFNGALFLFLLAISLLLQRGHYTLSAFGFLFVFWLYALLAMIFFGGLTNPIIGTQVVLILAAGTLLRRRGLLFFTLWSAVFTALVLLLDVLGHLPQPLTTITPWRALIIHTSNLIGAGLIIYYWLQLNQRHIQTLQEKEASLEDILNALPDALMLINTQGIIEHTYTSRPELLPGASRDCLGQPYHEVLPAAIVSQTKSFLQACIQTGEPQQVETEIETPTGARWFEIRLREVQKDGRPYVLWIARDITASRQTQTALRKSQELLSTAVNGARLGIWDWHIPRGQMHLNAVAAEILGHTATTLPATESFWREIIPREDFERALAQIDQHLAGASHFFAIEHRVRTPEGETRWVLSRAHVSERDAAGRPVRITGIFLDITQLKETQAELQALSARLEERVKERTAQLKDSLHEMEAFTYTISHDLRAPLRGIHGHARILLDDHAKALPPEARELLQRIAANARQMGAMIDQLLTYTRLGNVPLRRERFDTRSLVAEVVQALAPPAHCRIVIDDLPPTYGDPRLLRQVWQNLIDNAIKYSRTEERPLIRISGQMQGQETVFRIADNGIGFSMAYAEKIFGVFERLNPAPQYPGTGIGLATCKRIVQRHGGHIWAESSPGKGSIFAFSLPQEHMV